MNKYLELFKSANSKGLLDFSPSDIKLGKDNYSCAQIIDMLRNDEINLETIFQRKSGLWDVATKSKFIESMMLKFPIPPLYFNVIYRDKDQKYPHWEVIDGLQRLSTIKEFVLGGNNGKQLILDGMEFYPDLNGQSYDELPRHLIRNFESCQLQLHLVYPHTPKQVIRRIFERINTTNLKLTDQEIRNAIYQGDVIFLLKKSSSLLLKYDIKIQDKRMGPQELVLRFYAFYCFGTSHYPKESNLGSYLDQSIRALNELSINELNDLLDIYDDALYHCHKIFGVDCFKGASGRFNRSLFEVLMVFVARLSRNKKAELVKDNSKLLTNYFSLLSDERFLKSVSSATSRIDNVKYRFQAIENLL
ncbi:DUF262 domain-containing protein [Serratia nevei]|uniref:DUF262 domain-containing protein n=1 Tax=Serratia nevei TaxID=2703794 RepID=UPI0030191410